MQPKISIIIPFYNVERYIGECLDSVLSQSYQNLEVICVDDCGKDGSRAIVDSYAARDERLKVLSLPGNRGIGPARNAGMDAMTGEYFLFLDSDDLLPEDAVLNLYETLVRTGADMVTGRYEAFADEDRADLHASVASLQPTFDLVHDSDVQIDEQNFQKMLDASYAVVWGKLYSVKYMREKGIRFHDSRILHEDKGFWLKCIGSLPHYASTGSVVTRYRIRPNSSMTSATKEERERRKRDIRIAVKDGVAHLYQMHDEALARRLHELTKGHRSFAPQLETRLLGGLLRLRWYKHEKLVELCRVQIYREKVRRDGVKEYRLFGLLLHRDENPA
ncbi:MAG: glycosyltransferase family 2 protein [Mailhella sp.]|nr:glycosyltransferase family 2 protein [Mailhella sp.]